jgi:hypothetical protein
VLLEDRNNGVLRPAAVGALLLQKCSFWAVLTVAIALSGQFVTVQYNYGGNWTGLFCAGDHFDLPPAPEFDNVLRRKDSLGFDGQFYFLIAHDPLMTKGWASYVEWPGLRYRRILLPGLAHLLAFGNPQWIVGAYVSLNLVFLWLGTWWTSRYAISLGRHPVWGMLFPLLPASLISLDRLTVDLAFAALFIGVLYYWRIESWGKVLGGLVLMCLTRETGLLVVGAIVMCCAQRRWMARSVMAATTCLPFFAWSSFVNSQHPPVMSHWLVQNPYAWTINALWNAAPAHASIALARLIRSVDLLAFAGLVCATVLSLAFAWKKRWDATTLAGAIFAVLGLYLLSLDQWTHVYDYGRVLSPMALSLVLCALAVRRTKLIAPVMLMSAGTMLHMSWQLLAVLGIRLS